MNLKWLVKLAVELTNKILNDINHIIAPNHTHILKITWVCLDELINMSIDSHSFIFRPTKKGCKFYILQPNFVSDEVQANQDRIHEKI